MTRIKVLIFALCFALLGSPIAAIASDISGALYYGTIVISNNSTANTNVATVANISTTNLITGQYLNATANNCVIRNSSGSDIPFMPAYTPSSPWWCMWVPSIGEDSYITHLLYTDYSFGGELYYFPGSGGMSTSDDVTMEWGDDFESAFTNVWTDTATNLELLKKRYSANIQNYESGLLAGMYYFEPIDITPGVTAAWVDVDVSRYIPLGATGVILELEENGAASGFRENGSADNRILNMEHNWITVGVDSDLIFEAYMAVGGTVYLVGYTDDSWTFNTNASDVSLVPIGNWEDVDISALAPNAIAAVIEVNNTAGVQTVGLRKKGSADARNGAMAATTHYFAVVGLDDDQIFQGWIGAITVDYWLVGYCTAGGTFDTNLADKSLVGINVWAPIDCSAEAPGADFLLFEVNEAALGNSFGFRANGSAHTVVERLNGHSMAVVPCDDGQIVEGRVDNLNVDFFLIGGIISGQEQPYQTHAIASTVSAAEHDVSAAIEAEPDMLLWASDVTVGVSMGQGILPVKILEEITLTAPAASVTFSGITGNVSLWDSLAGVTSRHLVVMVNARATGGAAKNDAQLQFNGDTGNNYNFQYLFGQGAGTPSAAGTNQPSIFGYEVNAAGGYPASYSGGMILIPHAFNTTNHKAVLTFSGAMEEISGIVAGRWADTSAVTSVTLFPSGGANFDTGSTFLLGVIDERYLVEEAINPAADFVVDFNNILQTGHDLVVIGYSQSDLGAVEDEIIHEINNDAHAPAYPTQKLTGRAGVAAAAQQNDEIGMTSGDNAPANEFGALIATYSQYAEIVNDVHYTSLSGYHESTGPTSEARAMSGRWPNVATITQIELYPNAGGNFKAGSLFSLYRVPRYVIDRQELTAVAPTITFNNIPQNYQALQLNIYARSDDAIPISDDIAITLNTDAGPATFDWQYLEGTGAGPPTAARSAASNVLMKITAAGEGANEFGGGVVTFNQYANTIGHKHFLTISGTNENQVILRSSRWENTAAITRIDLDPVNGANFIAGSIFELVGLMPTEVFDITVDSEVKGLADGNFSAEDGGEDWIAGGDGTPYFEQFEQTTDDVLHQDIVWRYGNVFYDRSYYGVDFDGVDDLINCGNDVTLELSSATGTFECWIRTSGTVNRDFIVKGAAPPYYLFRTQAAGTILIQLFDGANLLRSFSVGTINDGAWHHIAGTFENGTFCRTYIDGTEDSAGQITDTLVGFNPAGNMLIGQGVHSGGFWDGSIDELRIYNRGLATAEIVANYNAGVGSYTPTDTTGLVGWWHFEEGSGVAAADSSGEGNNGVLTNGPWWVNGHVTLPYTLPGTNPATPTFRGASSDPNVIGNMTAFTPIQQAQAPAYVLGPTNPFITTAPNITGNFTTVPPTGTFPLAGVIAAVANATATPPQLPLLIIACFFILAASLTTSYTLRRFGSGSLIVKALVIIGIMGIFVALTDWGIDFWMVVIFSIIAVALSMMSRQITWR